jgi:uncharacterized membrane protein
MKKITVLNLALVLVSFGVALSLYDSMPDVVASHWNDKGEVNGYMGKFWGMFLLPIISAGTFLIFLAIPKMDPLKRNDEKFNENLGKFLAAIQGFFLYIFILTAIWNLGYEFQMSRVLAPAFAVLFFCCGIFIEKIGRNYFAGIRTPWTLNSEEVWNKTHKMGGKIFKAVGILSLMGLIFPNQAFFFIIGPVILAAAFLFIYSYILYRREKRS